MASFEQIVKFENEKPKGVVRLVEANGFYRAYNHSAYLFHQAIAQRKVTRKLVKNINQQLVYIGFPVDRLLERIGTRSHKKTEFGYDVELAANEMPSDEGYDEWRETVPTEAVEGGARRPAEPGRASPPGEPQAVVGSGSPHRWFALASARRDGSPHHWPALMVLRFE